jgi:hypothetical protein
MFGHTPPNGYYERDIDQTLDDGSDEGWVDPYEGKQEPTGVRSLYDEAFHQIYGKKVFRHGYK